MSLQQNYRLINIDRLDPDASTNFDLSTLVPADTGDTASIRSSAEAQALAGQIRQLLRGGDAEGALRGALENVPYGADDRAKVWYCGSGFALLIVRREACSVASEFCFLWTCSFRGCGSRRGCLRLGGDGVC